MKSAAKYILVALLVLSLVVLAGCGGSKPVAPADKPVEKPVEKKVLKVGSEIAYAPFEYKDEKVNSRSR